jgi:hypothetical protein
MGMRRWAQRGLIAALVAGTISAQAAMAEPAGVATHTTLATGTQQIGGRTVNTYAATVVDDNGAPARGIVVLEEQGKGVASAALNAAGVAEIRAGGLTAGYHNLHAVYVGNSDHAASQSEDVTVHQDAATSSEPSFALTINPTSLPASGQTLIPGDAGNVTVSVASVNGFTGFVSLSCAGAPVSPGSDTDNAIPVGVTCTFTPTNLQITSAIANSSNPTLTSSLTVQTTSPSGPEARNRKPDALRNAGSPLALAVLLPGVVGLGLLGRKRKLLGRAALVLLVGAVGVAGTSACNARYSYLHHPPTANYGTLPGDYTLSIWAQTSNGVNASEVFTTRGLTVSSN